VRLLWNLTILVLALPLVAQSNVGELRLKVVDPHGFGVKSAVELVSEANQYETTLVTDDGGALIARRLPFGVYRVQIEQAGFAAVSLPVEVRSAIPLERTIQLTLAAVSTSVTVQAADTLIDPHSASSVNQIGSESIASRPAALPGRSLQDLVNSEPG
jgi:hypothetical protein